MHPWDWPGILSSFGCHRAHTSSFFSCIFPKDSLISTWLTLASPMLFWVPDFETWDFLVCERVKRCCDDTRLPAWCCDWRGAIVSMTSVMCVHLGLCSFLWSFDSVWMKKTSAYWEGQANDRCNAFLGTSKSSIYRILMYFIVFCSTLCLHVFAVVVPAGIFPQRFVTPRTRVGKRRRPWRPWWNGSKRWPGGCAFWLGRHIVAPPFTNFVGGDT